MRTAALRVADEADGLRRDGQGALRMNPPAAGPSGPPWPVQHRPEAGVFEVTGLGGPGGSGRALCAYRLHEGCMVLHHTEVPPAFEGRGVAAALVQAALAHARAQGLKVQPRCSYVALYMRRHPQTLDLLGP